jgi:hypothetical protein
MIMLLKQTTGPDIQQILTDKAVLTSGFGSQLM